MKPDKAFLLKSLSLYADVLDNSARVLRTGSAHDKLQAVEEIREATALLTQGLNNIPDEVMFDFFDCATCDHQCEAYKMLSTAAQPMRKLRMVSPN